MKGLGLKDGSALALVVRVEDNGLEARPETPIDGMVTLDVLAHTGDAMAPLVEDYACRWATYFPNDIVTVVEVAL